MGFWDVVGSILGTITGKGVAYLNKTNNEMLYYSDKYADRSPEELRARAQSASTLGERLGAAKAYKDNGYNNEV